jgi:hypothetical protein
MRPQLLSDFRWFFVGYFHESSETKPEYLSNRSVRYICKLQFSCQILASLAVSFDTTSPWWSPTYPVTEHVTPEKEKKLAFSAQTQHLISCQ